MIKNRTICDCEIYEVCPKCNLERWREICKEQQQRAYDSEAHAQKIKEFFAAPNPSVTGLADALFAVSETGAWPDSVSSVSVEQALVCWKIVEKLRTVPFPPHLRLK